MIIFQKLNKIAKTIRDNQHFWEKESFRTFKKFSKLELEKRIRPLLDEEFLTLSITKIEDKGEGKYLVEITVVDTITKETFPRNLIVFSKLNLTASGDDTADDVNSQAFTTNLLKQFYSQELCLMISEPVMTNNETVKCKFQTLQEIKDIVISNSKYTAYPEYANLIIDLTGRASSLEVLYQNEEILAYTVKQWFKPNSVLSKSRKAFFEIYLKMSEEEKSIIYLPVDCSQWQLLKELENKYAF